MFDVRYTMLFLGRSTPNIVHQTSYIVHIYPLSIFRFLLISNPLFHEKKYPFPQLYGCFSMGVLWQKSYAC